MTTPELIPYGEEIFLDYKDNMAIICKEHRMEVDELVQWDNLSMEKVPIPKVRCLEGPHEIHLDRIPSEIRKHISRKINSKTYQEAKIFDIDGYLVPASKEVQSKDATSDYFVIAQVKSNKKGEQVVIYAGKKGEKNKSQIFIDPKNAKMTFDQNDVNPSDIFVKFEATFRNGSKTTIEDIEPEKVR